jgi:hypothetical protein
MRIIGLGARTRELAERHFQFALSSTQTRQRLGGSSAVRRLPPQDMGPACLATLSRNRARLPSPSAPSAGWYGSISACLDGAPIHALSLVLSARRSDNTEVDGSEVAPVDPTEAFWGEASDEPSPGSSYTSRRELAGVGGFNGNRDSRLLAGDFQRGTDTAESPLPTRSSRRPHPVPSDTGTARVGSRPRSLRLLVFPGIPPRIQTNLREKYARAVQKAPGPGGMIVWGC